MCRLFTLVLIPDFVGPGASVYQQKFKQFHQKVRQKVLLLVVA